MAIGARQARARGQRKAAAKVHVSASADFASPVVDKDWRARRKKELEAEISALEKELKTFDPQAAANKVRQSLELALRRTKLRLEQHNLEESGI